MSQADLTMEGHGTTFAGQPPFSISTKKMAMWLFIIADTATFAGCLVAYGFLRNATPNWPRPFPSITNVALMTFVLITSSLTMLLGVRSATAGNKSAALRWTFTTAGLGIVFALLHLREWLELIHRGITIGSGLFGQTFFTITGLHLLHVVCGVIALLVVGAKYSSGRLTPSHVETTGLYWHFVDLVWMFVVPLVYLTNFSK